MTVSLVLPGTVAAPLRTPHILLYTLGNYTHPSTKHSLGQYVIPSLLRRFDLPKEGDFLRLERKHDCWLGSGMIRTSGRGDGEGQGFRLSIAKPRLLMNINGRPVPFLLKSLAQSFPQHPSPTLIALHDNLTLPPLSVGKPRSGVTHQGHGGLSSIESSLKSKDFWRLGLGIGRGGNGPGGGVVKWVLSELSREEKGYWDGGEGVERIADVIFDMAARLRKADSPKIKVAKK